MDIHPSRELENFVAGYWPYSKLELKQGLRPLSGDAGFRRYFRADASPSAIAVDSPPDKESNLEYVRTNLLLSDLGVRVPKMLAVDFSSGYFLLEDLGKDHLLDQLSESGADGLYRSAMEQLSRIQACERQPAYIPDYDRHLLLSEMNLFREWFMEKLLGVNLDADRNQSLSKLFEILAQEALAQPRVLVHRDYHSRNLMCTGAGDIAVIDFQDAVWGPVTYDLVSLARDCYVRLSPARVDDFVGTFAERLLAKGKINAGQHSEFRRWFDLMGLQRHLKVLGIFARLHLRDGKSGYLNDLPLVLRYTLEVMSQYADSAEIASWIVAEVIPLCEKQSWYSDWSSAGVETELS